MSDSSLPQHLDASDQLASTSLSRRRLLGAGLGSALAGATAGLMPQAAQAQAQNAPAAMNFPLNSDNPRAYRFQLGELEAAVINDGQQFFPGALDFILYAWRIRLEQALQDHAQSIEGLPFTFNVLLLKKGEEIILFDAGYGTAAQEQGNGFLLEGLAELGIAPEQVTTVLVSHGHGDHISGLINEQGGLVFANASVQILQQELDFWMAEKPDFSLSQLPEEFQQGMIAEAKRVFGALEKAGKLSTLEPGAKLLDGTITVRLAAGHTPGHCIYEIETGEDKLVHMADLAHNFVVQFVDPRWAIAFDTDSAAAVETRKEVFAELAEKKTLVMGYHMPFPSLGYIVSRGLNYAWIPQSWAVKQG